MAAAGAADTIRVLVATDNHVGAHENDPVRGDDSWKAFDEIMRLARERDVDMVLLAGDLFHEHKPSKASMYHVMRSIRQNCLGEKPCELEMLSDASEHFDASFTHANYEDMDINVAIPVFSIHGNHDDPTGRGYFGPLDVLQMSGLLNYYGKTPEADKIDVKPVLLQKGNTKLALFGLSNVRDERLYRTFRNGSVKFFRPSQQKNNWFNLLSVHQNHHEYSQTGWLPEKFLPDFMQLVIWGHEHECKIDPERNTEQGFRVMQPGSSVATSLVAGEAIQKHVAILSITGQDFESEKIPLKSIRPFIMKEITLQDEVGMDKIARKENNRTLITRHLESIVNGMIDEANTTWQSTQDPVDPDARSIPPLPLIRLRVEYSAPEGGKYDMENPTRFSNRFADRVANSSDVIQLHCRKRNARKTKDGTVIPDADSLSQLSLDSIKIDKLVREFLQAQSLTILPQNLFGEAVNQFIEKDDKHAMEDFVQDSLKDQIKNLVGTEHTEYDEEDIAAAILNYRMDIEKKYSNGLVRQKRRNTRVKPKPTGWDSDLDGPWEDQAEARIHSDEDRSLGVEAEGGRDRAAAATSGAKELGRGRGMSSSKSVSRAAAVETVKPAAPVRGKNASVRGDRRGIGPNIRNNNDEDVVMLDEDEEVVETGKVTKTKAPPTRKPPPRSTRAKQTTLSFSSQPKTSNGKSGPKELSDDVISDDNDDDDDAFEPMLPAPKSGRKR